MTFHWFKFVCPRRSTLCCLLGLAAMTFVGVPNTLAQEPTVPASVETTEPTVASGGADAQDQTGFLIELSAPLTTRRVEQVLAQLTRLADAAKRDSGGNNGRVTVVLHLQSPDASSGSGDGGNSSSVTSFEDALKLARAISGPTLKRVRPVVWVDSDARGHDVLIALAAESLLVSPTGTIGDVAMSGDAIDETVELTFQAIAKRRSILPPEMVAGLVDSGTEVVRVRLDDGEQLYASGEKLDELRESGKVVREATWKMAGDPLVLSADQLRELRAATAIVSTEAEVADRLGLAKLRDEAIDGTTEAVGVLLNVTGKIGPQRVRRWQTNLAATMESGETNTWFLMVDSPGGNLSNSVSLSGALADPGPSIRTVGGFISGEARGDASLVALACRPLMMHPNATLGGSGADAIDREDVQRNREIITLIAASTGRSEALLRGLLDPSLTVHRYTNRRTGRIRYAVPDELAESEPDLDATWKRGDRIDLSVGLKTREAIELGLVDSEASSLADAVADVGLNEIPPELADRGLVRWVERIGRHDGLAFGLLLLGFMMLSTEASAPGLGVPGFVAMLCFAFFFWTKFLAGTAEWAELLAFGLGIACLAIEVFVLPGFGIFGIGGLFLTVLGVVLMSQTFVIPQNAYQVGELTRGIWIALGGLGGIVLGFLAVRMFLPRAAMASGLSMGTPEPSIEQFERVAHFEHLLGQTGVAATPLRPSGKARFGETLVAVVSDATAIETGDSVRVIEVLGNRIVVEAVNA